MANPEYVSASQEYRLVPIKDNICVHDGFTFKTDENGVCPVCLSVNLISVVDNG